MKNIFLFIPNLPSTEENKILVTCKVEEQKYNLTTGLMSKLCGFIAY
jgi:hypothetical protein